MEKVEQYQAYIQKLITDHAKRRASNSGIERQTIFDPIRHHYQLMYVGWKNKKRYYSLILHFDIKDDKILIQHDGTEIGYADELVKLGVPREDIVLAFHEPSLRKYTEFGEG